MDKKEQTVESERVAEKERERERAREKDGGEVPESSLLELTTLKKSTGVDYLPAGGGGWGPGPFKK